MSGSCLRDALWEVLLLIGVIFIYRYDQLLRTMNELTMVLFLLSVGVFLVSFYIQRSEIVWLGFFISICSICLTIVDTTLGDDEVAALVAIELFVMLTTGWKAFQNKA